jgi:hypothetical protein
MNQPKLLSRHSEHLWVVAFAAVVMLATTVPYLMGYATQDTNWRFTGFVISVEDGNGFIAKMLSGAAGAWLFRTPYTAFPQRGLLIFLPYLLLGKLVSPSGSHEELVVLYHAFRLCAGGLAILATYAFLSFFVTDVRYRRFGLVLATLGGGLGWILVLLNRSVWLGSLPLEFYSPESFGFLSLYVYPHYALAQALLLWSVLAYLKACTRLEETTSLAWAGSKMGVLWLLTMLAQPITGMLTGAVVGIYLLALAAWQVGLEIRGKQTHWPRLWKMSKLAAWAGLLPAPLVLYNLASTRLDPFVRMWTDQSHFKSPHPLHYLLAYGLILPFVIVGGRHLWRKEGWTAKLPIAWILSLPILAYAPIGVQRRLPQGIWVALVVLAMKALESSQNRTVKRSSAMLWFALPSTMLLLVWGVVVARHPSEPVFRPADEVVTFQYLAEQAAGDTIVLSSYETGNALPAWAPVFVVVGHGPESIDFAELMPRVKAFYQVETPTSERLKLLDEFHVDYVYFGPDEQKLGRWDPHTASFLSLVYQRGDDSVFRYVNE